MTIEYFYNLGMEDAKKLMEEPDVYNIDYIMNKIDEFQKKCDNECATMYAFGFMEAVKSKEKTR